MRRTAATLLVGLALVLAACGGSGDPYQHDQDEAHDIQAG
jgi:hypothetical protein